MSWKEHLLKTVLGVEELRPESLPFHLFNPKSGEAVSAQIFYTLSPAYSQEPEGILDELKILIGEVADYAPSSEADLAAIQIESKTIHLAIPEATSPVQWRYLDRAIRHANSRDVSMIITRIRGWD